jgi:hypothetical protein
MKDLSIPIPPINANEKAEVVVTVGGKKLEYHFRIESFPWDTTDELSLVAMNEVEKSLARITRLKQSIEGYDADWELIQIFNPAENAKYIQVLYRKRLT